MLDAHTVFPTGVCQEPKQEQERLTGNSLHNMLTHTPCAMNIGSAAEQAAKTLAFLGVSKEFVAKPPSAGVGGLAEVAFEPCPPFLTADNAERIQSRAKARFF